MFLLKGAQVRILVLKDLILMKILSTLYENYMMLLFVYLLLRIVIILFFLVTWNK